MQLQAGKLVYWLRAMGYVRANLVLDLNLRYLIVQNKINPYEQKKWRRSLFPAWRLCCHGKLVLQPFHFVTNSTRDHLADLPRL